MSNFVYHKPRYKTIDNKNDIMTISNTGGTSLMCPECFHVIETDIISIKTINNHKSIEDFSAEDKYYGVCPNCKKYVNFINMDVNMAEIINILNTKGYYTVFCCEGHIESYITNGPKGFSSPYIYFYLWSDSKVLKTNPLPDEWYITKQDEECEIFVIRDHIIEEVPDSINKIEEYVEWIESNWDKKKSIEAIYNWAVNLPDKSQGTKYYHHTLVKMFGGKYLAENSEKLDNYNEE